MKKLFYALLGLLILWLGIELAMRLSAPKTGFYESIGKEQVQQLQDRFGVKVVTGDRWIHLGWVADPENESYLISHLVADRWEQIASVNYGSALIHEKSGRFRVEALKKDGSRKLAGEVDAAPTGKTPPLYRPQIASAWQPLFKPERSGYYINDHTLFQDINGTWRLLGITSRTDGDFNAEKYFAAAHGNSLPPQGMMKEDEPAADFGELAWAPHVIKTDEKYHLFWSPHRLMQMDSADGIAWVNPRLTMPLPVHPHFRDAMVLQVAPDQWLLYTTGRGFFYSRVDIYQSFDLEHWQYIRPAQTHGLGSELNSSFASTESPFVAKYQGRYYLSVTHNNGTFFWHGLLLLIKQWINPESYNDTRVFHASNPYDFGVYHGKEHTSNLVTELKTHAPEWVYDPQSQKWFITTAGWPWVTTLTHGEVSIAELTWDKIP